jgi:hypothetical protein
MQPLLPLLFRIQFFWLNLNGLRCHGFTVGAFDTFLLQCPYCFYNFALIYFFYAIG